MYRNFIHKDLFAKLFANTVFLIRSVLFYFFFIIIIIFFYFIFFKKTLGGLQKGFL